MRILLSLLGGHSTFWIPSALADGDHSAESTSYVDALLHLDNFMVALYGLIAISILVGLAIWLKPGGERGKKILFWSISAVSLLVTGIFITQTTVKNFISETGGPVHWHADFEVYQCDQELDLLDPTGLLNRIGTPILHEHGDKRIHVEGTLLELEDASLGVFFDVIGGELTDSRLVLPTNDGVVTLENGMTCEDQDSEVQVFVWTVEEGVATQRKLENPAAYVPSPYSYVPPGDCVIFELSPVKDRTEHLCEQYAVAESNEELVIESAL